MSYTPWSVAYAEQPSSAKWNELGANDAYFEAIHQDHLANGDLLGFASRTSDFSSATQNADVDVTSLSVTVTVPAGGRSVKITAFCRSMYTSAAAQTIIQQSIKESTTVLESSLFYTSDTNSNHCMHTVAVVTPSAGSHTYKVAIFQNGVGTMVHTAGATYPAYILAELI